MGMSPSAYGPDLVAESRLTVPEPERVLGSFENGAAALTLAEHDGWTSVFSASPGLPPGILRNLARRAGVHIYSETDDAFYAGRGLLALHAWEAGPKAIALPRPVRLREILGGESEERVTDRIGFEAEAFETRVYELVEP
jgi:hypothetical protein